MKFVGHRCTRWFFHDVKLRTKRPGNCPQTLIEVHWRLCQYMCNKLWYESGLLPSVVSCRSLQQVSHLTVSLPKWYISFARIMLFFFRKGRLQPPQPPRPICWCVSLVAYNYLHVSAVFITKQKSLGSSKTSKRKRRFKFVESIGRKDQLNIHRLSSSSS